MRITRPVLGKILQHARGLGVPSPDTVRERARELALIEGRDTYNDQDWKTAFHELHGGHHSDTDESQSVGEELVAEGLDEAAHDQMLEAHRTQEETEEF